MTRLSLVVLERDERRVLRGLGHAGVLQLTRQRAGPETAPFEPRDRSVEMARWDILALRLVNLRQALESPSTEAAPGEPVDGSIDGAEATLHRMEQESRALVERRGQLRKRLLELAAIHQQLSDYRGLDIPLDAPDDSAFLHFVTGTLPAGNLGRLEAGRDVALLPLNERQGRQVLLAMTTRANRPALDQSLRAAGFVPEPLPQAAGATTESLRLKNQGEREQVTAELAQLDGKLQHLARSFEPLLAGLDRLVDRERRMIEAEQHFPRTESAILITGWMPGDVAAAWKLRLFELAGGRCVMSMAPAGRADAEQAPVLLRHPRWLRPFAGMVTAYGLPKYLELEPTFLVAISYLLMFGMMFGDVGHGAVLALAGLGMRLAARRAPLREIGRLLMLGGLSSVGFGAVYGSYFGLPQLKDYALWHDPMAGDPMSLLAGAVEIGIVMISLGLVLNTLNHFRRGDVIGGLLDKFGLAGAVFYWGALALALGWGTGLPKGWLRPASILLLGLPVLGWMLKEPVRAWRRRRAGAPDEPGHGYFSNLLEPLVGVFEALLSYFANTISFVRLGAYAMSHAALLVATFMMAENVRHFSPGGNVLAVLVIILGNLVALVLEGIVAAVQALRLEYYEFFGKFFSGDGKPFKPFCLQTATVAEAPP